MTKNTNTGTDIKAFFMRDAIVDTVLSATRLTDDDIVQRGAACDQRGVLDLHVDFETDANDIWITLNKASMVATVRRHSKARYCREKFRIDLGPGRAMQGLKYLHDIILNEV